MLSLVCDEIMGKILDLFWFIFLLNRDTDTRFSSDTDFDDSDGRNAVQGKGKVFCATKYFECNVD